MKKKILSYQSGHFPQGGLNLDIFKHYNLFMMHQRIITTLCSAKMYWQLDYKKKKLLSLQLLLRN